MPEPSAVATSPLSNLELLYEAQKGLSREDRNSFDNYLIGALSVATSRAKWVELLAAAKRDVEPQRQPVAKHCIPSEALPQTLQKGNQ